MSDPEQPAPGPTEQLARFVVEWRPGEIPPAALREARRALIDILGVALVGSREPGSRIVASFARREGAGGPAVLIGHDARTSASLAALTNGTSGHALDYDASATVATSGHPVVCLAPSALAVAEEVGASGRQLLEAIIVGFEVVSRLGRSGGGETGAFYGRGFHGTSVFGIFGATAVASRLFDLDVAKTRRAFGIAVSGPKGVRANYGTMTKPLHAGEANRAGVMAAMLAAEGFSANESAIEARFGWRDAVIDNAVELGPFDGKLAITEGVNFKRFPSGGAGHGAVRAMLRLRSEHHLEPGDIAGIEVAISRNVLEKTLLIDWPTTGLAGKFSLAYNVAAAWADGRVTVDTFADHKLDELAPYRSRITARPVEGRPPVLITAQTTDGRTISCTEPTGKSTPDDPAGGLLSFSDQDLAEKFRENVAAVRSTALANELLDLLTHIETVTKLGELTELLR